MSGNLQSLSVVLAKFTKFYKYWSILDPIYRDRAAMVPSFAADNEDKVIEAILDMTAATTSAISAEVTDTEVVFADGPQISFELDDEKTPMDKILDMDAVASVDNDNALPSSGRTV